LTYGQKTSQNVSYMTFWDETVLRYVMGSIFSPLCCNVLIYVPKRQRDTTKTDISLISV